MRAFVPTILLALGAAAHAAAPPPPVSDPVAVPAAIELSRLPGDETVARLLWTRSPDLVAARARIEAARGALMRAGLFPNPGLEGAWSTIPIGTTNPRGLSAPLQNVPNYAASLSSLVEIAKRGPRKRAARSAFEAATLDAYDVLRQRWYDFRERVGEVATAEVRAVALSDLLADAHGLTELQRQRARRGDTAGLDVDRAALDESKFRESLDGERQRLAEAVAECARVAGVPCTPFEDGDAAERFLATGLVPPGTTDLDARPDLQSLTAQRESADAALELAHNRRIPDPTLRLGYLRDQFVVAGNQRNSLFAGISIPLPVFDRGQADALQAVAARDAAGRARDLLRAQAARDLDALAAQARDADIRLRALEDSSLPLARQLVATLEGAVQRGGAPLSELLLARRTLGELMLAAADVRLLSFRIAAEIGRAGGAGPPAPIDAAPTS